MFWIIHNSVNYVFYHWIHPTWKLIVRWVTGKCELQRITDGSACIGIKTMQLEFSLKESRYFKLRDALIWKQDSDIDRSTKEISTIKYIRGDQNRFAEQIKASLTQIHGYQELIFDVDILRCIRYSKDNPEHESMLLDLWNLLCPDVRLENRISKQWDHIGFQGTDPATDFRGMGILGLQNLVYFARHSPGLSKQALSHSHHPQHGYTFAIVGINITALVVSLLEKGHLKPLLYHNIMSRPTLDHFNQIYCYVFTEFDADWWEKKPNIMEFGSVKKEFKANIKSKLLNQTIMKSMKIGFKS